ncbi:MAG: ribbon-helix-helix protein, CopG family [Deltaproteobacteria bacterium]|nr:ribbon-helix-helix protein, CopG family [Deltaproteobacteria bacterium]MBW1942071.1 ribbon-helix-helix protein, CopG family [Deltaproteobacteria bacterium]MBW2208083.1 ribbon-helix-helix protein, CopG family [Deltaproteobacteria bacterium]
MRTIQMTLDENLVESVDKLAKELKTTRSAFTRDALSEAVDRIRAKRLEEEHRKGYERRPVGNDEFSEWEEEQDWGSE